MEVGLELENGGRIVLWRALERELTTVGSNPECDICIPDPGVLPVHFQLRLVQGTLQLVNHHTDGTRVGDELVEKELRLADGDTIHLGPIRARVRWSERAGAGGTQTLQRGAPAAAGALFLLHGGKRQPVSAAGLTIGSDPDCDVVLDDPYASRHHARLYVEGGRVMVRDLGSRNGVLVERSKIREGEVPRGASLSIGQTTLTLAAEEEEAPPANAVSRLVGSSPAMQSLRQLLRRMAETDAPVLILGETGTGKEVVARALVDAGGRADKPYLALNCGALGKNLIESELFGHERGAFTGAVGRKAGAFEVAHGGTLFLDELGELPAELQPQLLRVVENGEVRRVGGTDIVHVNVRLLAATNRRLEREVAAGRFREDLYHRLNVLTLELPPLCARKSDIPELVKHFLAAFGTSGAELSVDAEGMKKLEAYDWPGNVRELRNVLQRAVLMRDRDSMGPADLVFTPSTLVSRVQTSSAGSTRTLAEIEREAIIAELERHNGNKKDAAAALGISRSTIHRKIEEYAIETDES